MGNHKRRFSDSSLLYKISLLVIVLCGIIILYSSHRLYLGIQDYQQARRLQTINEIVSPFTDGLKNFMFERGRMNVALSADDSISADDLSFISEHRSASNQYFEEGFTSIEKSFPEETLLRHEYEKIIALRIIMDAEAAIPLSKRDPGSRILWYSSCTDYINLVSSRLKNLGGNSNTCNIIGNYNELIIDTLHFRSIVGNEASILIAAITGSKTLTNDEYMTLLALRGESKEIWANIESTIELIGSDQLTAAMETVHMKYYEQFRPNQDRFLQLILNGQLYNGADEDITVLAVPALDSILLLADEAISGINHENQKNMTNGFQSFVSGILQVIAGVLIIILIPTYLHRRLTQPLDNLVDLIEKLSYGKTDIIIPSDNRSDEIGKLTSGVVLLQKSIEEEQALKLELQETVLALEELSIKDPLTGLYNRRFMLERMNELELRYKRNKSVFSVILCDIDHFKNINDRFGHDCGDTVLSHIAKLMLNCCREQDFLARWGGEEFLLLLPDTNPEGARILAERIRQEIEASYLDYGNERIKLSMTFGVSEYKEDLGIRGTIHNADMALMQGKNSGRNRVIVV